MLHSKNQVSNYSRLLIALAWTVEGIAVLIGLTISIVVAVSALNSYAGEADVSLLDGTSAIVVAALPFVLIAVVELCKIPLTFAFMSVRNIVWRSMFLAFVLFLCLITFETMLNGFERNFSNLNRSIDTRKNQIESAENQIGLLENRRNFIVKFTEEEVLEDVAVDREEIDSQYRTVAQRIDTNAQQSLREIDYSFQDELEQEITRIQIVLDDYYSDWRDETEAVEERFSTLILGNISGSSDERDRLLAELEALKAEFAESMATATIFNRATRENKYRALIKDKEDQLGVVVSGYLGGTAIEQQSTMEAQLKQQLEFVNNKYTGRIADANERIDLLKQEIEQRLQNNSDLENNVLSRAAQDKARFATIRNTQNQEVDDYLAGKMVELDQIADRSFGIDEQIFEIRNNQRRLQSEINHLINQNQIYRLAMYWDNEDSATDVERGTVGIIALLWFGSLSLIASVCGVMLALAGFYLQRFIGTGEPMTDPGMSAPENIFVDAVDTEEQDAAEKKLRSATG